jgi:FkbM family methyltransferase
MNETFEEKIIEYKEPLLKYIVRNHTNDEGIVRGSVLEHTYGENFSGIVVVIGAHIGGFSCFAASRGADRVYCFEPEEGNYNLLVRNIKLNGFENKIFPRRMAIGKQKEKRHLYVATPYTLNPGRHGLFYANYETFQEVDCESLDDIFLEEKLDVVELLKSDCEGGEYEFFPAASEDTLSRIKKIAMETHFSRKEELIKFFTERNFKAEEKLGVHGVPVSASIMIFQNLKYEV